MTVCAGVEMLFHAGRTLIRCHLTGTERQAEPCTWGRRAFWQVLLNSRCPISCLDSMPFIALVYSSLSFQKVPGLLFKYHSIGLAKPRRRCLFWSVLC